MALLIIIVLGGFILLVKGADFFVEGASNIASYYKIPQIIIGLTIVAFGTSAPEAAVSILAAIKGNGGIALGNVIGSNIFNITFVLGLAAFINPLKVDKDTIRKDIPFCILTSIVLLIVMWDINFQKSAINSITRGDGLILLCLFTIFLYSIMQVANNKSPELSYAEEPKEPLKLGKEALNTVGGLIGILIGGTLIVNSSTDIAYRLGISEGLVGLTIVAVGTSLPELITSVVAAQKNKSDIAFGNIIGSNIFNVVFILGISSVISPVAVYDGMIIDASIIVVISIIVLIFSYIKSNVSKNEGIFLFSSYFAYMMYLINRG